jgi:hypothetical protein
VTHLILCLPNNLLIWLKVMWMYGSSAKFVGFSLTFNLLEAGYDHNTSHRSDFQTQFFLLLKEV